MEINMDDLQCDICFQQFEDPVTDACGHTFCRECIGRWYQTATSCPISKKSVNPNQLNVNLLARKLVGWETGRCSNSSAGCSWKGKVKVYHRYHKDQCQMAHFPKLNLQTMMEILVDPLVTMVREESERGLLIGLRRQDGSPYPGMFRYADGDSYEGYLQGQAREGLGRLRESDGTVHEGTWQNDIKNGYFITIKNNEVVFQGRIEQGLYEGPVLLVLEIGTVFATYKAGQPQQPVKLKTKRKWKYEGSVDSEFSPEGQGRLRTDQGLEVTGNFEKWKPVGRVEVVSGTSWKLEGTYDLETNVGEGITEFFNYGVYEGTLVKGKRHGKGKFILSSGEVHEGEFKEDSFTGEGSITFTDKTVLTGNFENGRATGPATKTFPGGNKLSGNVTHYVNTVTGPGTFEYVDGTVVEGPIKNDQISGKGKITFPNGNLFEGEILNNQMHGKGVLKYADGRVFTGTCTKGVPDGEGSLMVPNEGTYAGKFVKGVLHGKVSLKTALKRILTVEFKMGVKVEPVAMLPKPSLANIKPRVNTRSDNKPEGDPQDEKMRPRVERLRTEPDLKTPAKSKAKARIDTGR